MRYFFDTEFIDDGRTIELISIGIAAEDGREFYAEVDDADIPWERASAWVLANVRPHLGRGPRFRKADLGAAIAAFVAAGAGKPEFWAYVGAYDWVALCQLYGPMLNRPAGWPKLARDLKQLTFDVGNPTLPAQAADEHHALADARWNREIFAFLISRPRRG